MGKVQDVAEAYMGIREGEPHPIMLRVVGVGRLARESGEMEAHRVRRYSWQFWRGGC